MTYFESFILGLVQGLGEFLPISSSAHLIIVPWAFHFQDPGLAFDVALHLGTLLALVFYFWRDWIHILLHDRKLLGFLVIATIPGALFGFLLDDLAESAFRNPLLIAGNMVFLGILLWIADSGKKRDRELKDLNLKDSATIGLSQALALLPGVSRSGITMTTGLFKNLTRQTAARFSFLMAAPITLGACVFKLPHLFKEGISGPVAVGIITSAVVGFLSIKYLLRYVQFNTFRIFVYYRFLFASAVVFLYFLRG